MLVLSITKFLITKHFFSILSGKQKADTLGQPKWLGCVQNEIKACQEAIGLIDLSSQSMFEVSVSYIFLLTI